MCMYVCVLLRECANKRVLVVCHGEVSNTL